MKNPNEISPTAESDPVIVIGYTLIQPPTGTPVRVPVGVNVRPCTVTVQAEVSGR